MIKKCLNVIFLCIIMAANPAMAAKPTTLTTLNCSVDSGLAVINELYSGGGGNGKLEFVEIYFLYDVVDISGWTLYYNDGKTSAFPLTNYISGTSALADDYIVIDVGTISPSKGEILLVDSYGISAGAPIVLDYLYYGDLGNNQKWVVGESCGSYLPDHAPGDKDIARSPNGTGPFVDNGDTPTVGASNDDGSNDSEADHFELSHDNYGINCVAEEVTVTARYSDDTVVADYVGTIDLSTSTNHGTWTLKTGDGSFSDLTADDGAATYTFDASDNGVVVLELLNSHDESTNVSVIDGTVVDDNTEGVLNFNPIGFVISPDPIGTQVSCKPFPFTLTVVGQTLNHPECGVIEEYSGNKAIKFWFDYNDPATGSIVPTIAGQSLNSSAGTAAAQTVTFLSGVAIVTANYSDAGIIQVFARDDVGMGDPVMGTADEIVGGLDPFVVRPFGFDMQVTGNSGAQTTAGSIFTTSGTAFSLNLKAVCWQSVDDSNNDGIPDGHDDNDPTNNADLSNNVLTPNAAGTVMVTHQLWKPATGVSGVLGGTTTAMLVAGLSAETDLTYSEVGILELEETLTNYLSGGQNIVGKSGAVGRFYPHQFALTVGALSHRSDLTCIPASDYTYLDENLTFTYTLTAQSATGSTTVNYADGVDGFAKFSGLGAVQYGSIGTYTVGGVEDPGGTPIAIGSRLDIVNSNKVSSWSAGIAGFNIELNVDRDATADGPFTDTRFGVFVQDSDGVEIANQDLDVNIDTVLDHTQATDAASLRYGRLRLENAHGSEMLVLPMLMQAEYWNGSAFSWNVVDSCSSFSTVKLTLDSVEQSSIVGGNPIRVKGVVTTTATITNQPLSSGDGDLEFSAPGNGGDGWVDVQLTVPAYLQFDWTGGGDENPTSRATFGIYQGNEHIIYIRETTWR